MPKMQPYHEVTSYLCGHMQCQLAVLLICNFACLDLDFYYHVVGKMSGRLYLEYVVIDSWCRILGNELFHGMLIADNDVVPLVEQRIHCCRYYDAEEKEAA